MQLQVCVCVSHLCLQVVSHILHLVFSSVQRQELTETLLQHSLQLHTHKHTVNKQNRRQL